MIKDRHSILNILIISVLISTAILALISKSQSLSLTLVDKLNYGKFKGKKRKMVYNENQHENYTI